MHLSKPELLAQSIGGIVSEMIGAQRTPSLDKTGGRRMTLQTAAANSRLRHHRVRQFVLCRDAHPAARAARGDVPDLQLLPAGRRHRRSDGPRPRAAGGAAAMARRHRCAISRQSAAARAGLCRLGEKFGLKREDFLAIIDGMEMDVPQDIRAPDLATLDADEPAFWLYSSGSTGMPRGVRTSAFQSCRDRGDLRQAGAPASARTMSACRRRNCSSPMDSAMR